MIRSSLFALLLLLMPLAAGQPGQTFASSQGVAIEAYDAVAYFDDHKAVRGNPEYSFEWHGARWQFASAAHRDAFAADPAKYAPQYGGYCAYGMSRGYKATIDPAAFTIIEGKLYLNYSASVQDTWRKDTAGYIRKADAAWPRVKETTKVYR